MSMRLSQLEGVLAEQLACPDWPEPYPNGLQVEGKALVQHIVGGVTASQALLDEAVAQQADAVLVHHGFFWKQECPRIRGIKKRRIQTLLSHNISLFAYHLPLDIHPVLGNNVQLGRHCHWEHQETLETPSGPLLCVGQLAQCCTPEELTQALADRLQRVPIYCGSPTAAPRIQRIAWCTGAGQRLIERVLAAGIDTFITGEFSEPTVHTAREAGMHCYAAGHHATERYGIQALGAWLTQRYPVTFRFVDISNPV